MGSFGNFLGGLLVGAALGVTAIAFAAPKSGDDTRSDIKSIWNGALETGKDVAKRREEELWADFNVRVKSKADVLNANSTAPAKPTTPTAPTSTSPGVRTYNDPS
ncbi:MAG: hypothetical protein AVDCRST_MAG93-6288 [uncultured Chloroflexia bacterium]|uniref:YtxH domain-containing protein n=1 Tax=uncultured Chloroflexia bacterium TaxID=1672391 RepID=A0A6J4LJ43_9CHLR|nr:MAG: hypothetical protein AVDCRST_MAG93-6288 [uncultured Chloroflexia bacterium]